jgi:hypothetical protein
MAALLGRESSIIPSVPSQRDNQNEGGKLLFVVDIYYNYRKMPQEILWKKSSPTRTSTIHEKSRKDEKKKVRRARKCEMCVWCVYVCGVWCVLRAGVRCFLEM